MRRRRAAALVLAAALGACRMGEERLVPLVRVAQEQARERGRASVPTMEIGWTTRDVLDEGAGTLQESRASVTRGLFEVEVRCPQELAGREALVNVIALEAVPGPSQEPRQHTRLVRRHCPSDVGAPLRVSMGQRARAGPIATAVRMRAAPATRVETSVVEIPSGGELRFATALVQADGGRARAPARFVVHAVGPEGRRLTLASGRVPSDAAWHEVRAPLDPARRGSDAAFASSSCRIRRPRTTRSSSHGAIRPSGDPRPRARRDAATCCSSRSTRCARTACTPTDIRSRSLRCSTAWRGRAHSSCRRCRRRAGPRRRTPPC